MAKFATVRDLDRIESMVSNFVVREELNDIKSEFKNMVSY